MDECDCQKKNVMLNKKNDYNNLLLFLLIVMGIILIFKTC